MGIADRIYELVKGLPDPEASKILRFVESVRGRRVPVSPLSGTSISPCSASIAVATMA